MPAPAELPVDGAGLIKLGISLEIACEPSVENCSIYFKFSWCLSRLVQFKFNLKFVSI